MGDVADLSKSFAVSKPTKTPVRFLQHRLRNLTGVNKKNS